MELTTDWISEFEIEDDNYKKFYKEKITSVKIYFLYVNREQQLFHIKKDKLEIKNTVIRKEQLIEILNKYKNYKNRVFTPLSIIKYNITLEPGHINEYIINNAGFDYLTAETSIEDILWYDSILFMNDINSLYIVFKEKWKTKHNNTKKIYIRRNKLSHRKTKKKKLKETSQ